MHAGCTKSLVVRRHAAELDVARPAPTTMSALLSWVAMAFKPVDVYAGLSVLGTGPTTNLPNLHRT